MELKKYQKRVIADLKDYLEHLSREGSLEGAFRSFWATRGVTVGQGGAAGYQNTIEGVPQVCYKVPTGGGKTLLACASAQPIFQSLPPARHQAVVWLVPSESILTQTLAALKNPTHPYRRQLDADFGGRVHVYSKEELLAGQNFNPVAVAEQLSVMVLSYDSFRARSKDGRKAYQANGNLIPFSTALGVPEQPIPTADQSALFQVINQLNPIVIVDESHHATSSLSLEMLGNFNPSFILELTATPKKQANVISYVSAFELKAEHMVKLPVVAYNRASQTDVITGTIDLRQSLETAASEVREQDGRYVRPIALFQAQPKAREDATSFERLRSKLVAAGIPAAQIAIKTAEVNELRGVDLLSPECEIRYIITVNALKEGWDCPFAYVLASLANKTSQVDVEQVLGRVLRQPHATRFSNPLLNMSYVLTSSRDFNDTLTKIISGLNAAGFSKDDVRAVDVPDTAIVPEPRPVDDPEEDRGHQLPDSAPDTTTEEFLEFDEQQISTRLNTKDSSSSEGAAQSGVSSLLAEAQQREASYGRAADAAAHTNAPIVPAELEDAVVSSHMFRELADEFAGYALPQFVTPEEGSALFSEMESGLVALHHEALGAGFTLRGKDTRINLTVDEQMFQIDVRSAKDVPRAFRMSVQDQRIMREHFGNLDLDAQRRSAAGDIFTRLKPINAIRDADLRAYVAQVVENFDATAMAAYLEHPQRAAELIQRKINGFLDEHKAQKFKDDLEIGRIRVDFTYYLPETINPVDATTTIGGSLYEAEDRMNKDEVEFATRFSAMSNVRWWHRNIERRGFCINGPINHYPDFLVMTTRGHLVAVEPKGAHLKNDDSRMKLRLGQKWAELAGPDVRYYMVFQDDTAPLEGAHTMSKFFELLSQL